MINSLSVTPTPKDKSTDTQLNATALTIVQNHAFCTALLLTLNCCQQTSKSFISPARLSPVRGSGGNCKNDKETCEEIGLRPRVSICKKETAVFFVAFFKYVESLSGTVCMHRSLKRFVFVRKKGEIP